MPHTSFADAKGLIRDTEIERTLRAYADPIFEENGLVPSSIRMYIVEDDTINAFVMGGSNIFINTGLIMRCVTPGMLIGVLAHETGHIAGGHLVRTARALEQARMETMLGYLLGAAAMASGAGDVGAAVISAGQNAAMRNLFSYSRANEQAADQSALATLDKLKVSANGMMQLFEILRKQENRKIGEPDPYTRTHPMNSDRIMHMRNHVQQSSIPIDAVPAGFNEMHERMVAKLEGFIDEPKLVMSRYPASNTSLKARYARAVAYYRSGDLAKALTEIDALLVSAPNDPYFHELKGQVLFENSRIDEARTEYEKSVSLLPDAPLTRADLGRVLLAKEDQKLVPQAISHLEYATSADPDNTGAWRLLATAYGKSHRLDLSHLALAEESLRLNKPEDAIKELDIAKAYIRAGSPAEIRAQDLRTEAEIRKKHKEEKDDK